VKNVVFNNLEDSKEKVFSFLRNLKNTHVFLAKHKSSIVEITELQALTKCSFEHTEQEIIYKLIIENCFLSEKLAPGSFLDCLDNVVSKKDKTETVSFFPETNSLKNLLDQSILDKNLKSLTEDAVNLAGYRGKISIEKSSNISSSIEAKNSYNFTCKTFEKKSIKLENAKIICIDGFIESVSELNRLFLEVSEKKQQVVIFSSGYHDDVLSTIEINKKRGTMFVVPVVVPFDIDNVNSLVDISIVTGAQLVSSNLGRIISTVDMGDSSSVDEITIFCNSVSIKNEKTTVSVELHIKNILDRAFDSKVQDLYENRIKRLSCNTVVIRLPDDKEFVAKSQQIDNFLRSYKSMLDFGISEDGGLFAKRVVASKFADKANLQIESLGSIVCRQ